MSDLQKALGSLQNAFAEFKEANDKRLDEIAKNQTPDPLTVEKVEATNAKITNLTDEINALKEQNEHLETAINRPSLGEMKSQNKLQEEAQIFFSQVRGQMAPVNADQVKEYQAYSHALNQYLRRGEAVSPEIRNTMSVGSDPDGGFWVTPAMSSRVGQLIYETSPMRSVAGVETIGTDAMEGFNDLDEASTGGWVGETASRGDTDTPVIGMWRIPVHEQYAQPKATQKMLDDSSRDVESWLAGKVADKLVRDENSAFINGDGVAKPRGFLTYPAGTPNASTWAQIQQLTTGVSAGFAATAPGDDLIDTVFSLKAGYRNGAQWLMTRLTLAEVRKLKDGDGNYLWQPNFTTQQNGVLLGYGITEAEDMPEIAADSLSIAFGNFNIGYQIVDRQGIRVLRDPFTDKPNVRFYTTKRTGGDVVNFEAIKLLKFGS